MTSYMVKCIDENSAVRKIIEFGFVTAISACGGILIGELSGGNPRVGMSGSIIIIS